MENCENSILELIDEKIELGRSLVAKLEQDFIDVDGALKTKRNIDKEIKFLEKVSDGNCSSRLSHLLMQKFFFNFSSSPRPQVDVMQLTSVASCSAPISTSSVI